MADYIKETKNNSKISIGVVIFVLFIYMLYPIPIPTIAATIAATILVGSEVLSIFGFQKKKTIPIYVHIVFSHLCWFFLFLMATTKLYDCVIVTEEQMGVIDYQRLCYKLMFLVAFVVYLWKTLFATEAVKVLNEKQSVLVPLHSAATEGVMHLFGQNW